MAEGGKHPTIFFRGMSDVPLLALETLLGKKLPAAGGTVTVDKHVNPGIFKWWSAELEDAVTRSLAFSVNASGSGYDVLFAAEIIVDHDQVILALTQNCPWPHIIRMSYSDPASCSLEVRKLKLIEGMADLVPS